MMASSRQSSTALPFIKFLMAVLFFMPKPQMTFIAILKMAKHNPDLPLPVVKASALNIPLRTY
jgi:hypothetical protein